jgi:hypothetical protein
LGSTGAPAQAALQRFSFLQKGRFHIFPAAKLECEKLRAAKLSISPLHHPCQGAIHFLRSLILSVFRCQAKVIEQPVFMTVRKRFSGVQTKIDFPLWEI